MHRKKISSSYLIWFSPSQTLQVRNYRRFGAQVSSIHRSDKLYDRLCVLSPRRLRPLLQRRPPLWRCALGWRWGRGSLWGKHGGTVRQRCQKPSCFPKWTLGDPVRQGSALMRSSVIYSECQPALQWGAHVWFCSLNICISIQMSNTRNQL